MNSFLTPFAICLYAILGLGLLGLPIGYSMICGSILYLLLALVALASVPVATWRRPVAGDLR